MGTIKVDTITPLSNTTDITIASNKFVGNASGNMSVPGEGGTNTNQFTTRVSFKAWCRHSSSMELHTLMMIVLMFLV